MFDSAQTSVPIGPILRFPDRPRMTMSDFPQGDRSRRIRCVLQQTMRVALLCVAAASAMAASPTRLQPLVDSADAEHHVGKFVFVELVTPDLSAAKKFYGSLLGWTFQDIGSGPLRYSEASLDGRLVAGLLYKSMRPGEQRQPSWLSFIAASDVDAAGKLAILHGAKSLSDPHDVPGRGRIAVYADPQGAVFGVIASSSGDPPDVLPEAGEWIWHSLFVPNADVDVAFYQALFDYEVFDMPEEGADQHLILASGDFARASANVLPSKRGRSHWLNYVRVTALGGKVLLEPRDDRHGGRLAIVADPQGAPFGLLEWPEDRSAKVTP
jgi:uncharacterized protein